MTAQEKAPLLPCSCIHSCMNFTLMTIIDSQSKSRSGAMWHWLLFGAVIGYFVVPYLNGASKHYFEPIYSSSSLVQSVSIDNVYDYLVTFSDIARPRKNSRSVVNGFNAR